MKSIRTWIQKMQKNGKLPTKNKWLLMLLAGILLLVIAMPISNQTAPENKEVSQDTETEEDYAEKAEEKLKNILEQMEGVGKVNVMITLASSSEKIIEKDEETTRDDTQSATSETTVYEETADRGQIPYVSRELTPKVEGVVVLCEGGDKPVVVQQITEAVEALFSVETHKIKVVKRK